MLLKHKDEEIASLADIQRLTAKDLRIILRSHSESKSDDGRLAVKSLRIAY